MGTGAIAAILFFVLAFAFIGVMLFTFVLLPRFVTPRTRHGIYIIDCPFPKEDIERETEELLMACSKYPELDIRKIKAAFKNTTVYFYDGAYVVDSFGNKNNAHVEGRIIRVANKDKSGIHKTAFQHELAHIALHACLDDYDEYHKHAFVKSF